MKRRIISFMSAALAALLVLQTPALAFDFNGSQENEATFETLEETRESSPEAVANLETNTTRTYMSHPVLDGYPEGTTYVYRSPELYGGRAGARLNTNILVFSDQSFEEKDAAQEYLESLGLIDIINEAVGSVVLVTPANPETGFAAADQQNYYKLQTAMLSQKASQTVDGVTTSFSDAEYFGGYAYLYVIGIDGGATFLNNYVAGVFDYVSRIAGMLLINGDMADISQVATFVPTYLVNAKEAIVEKYKKANTVDAYRFEGGLETFYNQAFPLRQVRVAGDADADAADYITEAYYGMFTKAMRLPIVKQGLYSASTPYQGYNFDEAPYSLFERNLIVDGVTADGIHLARYDEDLFPDIQTVTGDTLKTWFEYLPEEVVNGTAPDGTVPLILGMHGGGDDPRLFVDENGWLSLMGKERFALVAPEHQYVGYNTIDGERVEGVLSQVLPLFVEYILDNDLSM